MGGGVPSSATTGKRRSSATINAVARPAWHGALSRTAELEVRDAGMRRCVDAGMRRCGRQELRSEEEKFSPATRPPVAVQVSYADGGFVVGHGYSRSGGARMDKALVLVSSGG